jgi:hypothetical protein
LANGDADARADRFLTLHTKPRVLVVFAPEGDDDAKHRDGFVNDRQRFSLHALDGQEAAADVRAVVADRVVQKRHDRQ